MTDSLMQTAMGVSALLILVLILRRPIARQFGPRWAYALWLLPAARLFMPKINLPQHWHPQNWWPAFKTSGESVPVQPLFPVEGSYSFQDWVTATDPIPLYETASEPTSFIPALIALWLTGIVAGIVWAIITHHRQAAHIRRTTVTPPAHLRADITRAARLSGLKSPPQVRISRDKEGPLVGGLKTPTVILPHDFESRFTPEQQRLALLHEYMHVRRGDLWTTTAMLVFRILNWPNPLIHLAWPRFRADQEAACDASVLRVIGDSARSDYAETLLTAAKTSGRASPATGTGLTLSLHHPVKERLMTLGSQTQSKNALKRWALATMLLAGTALSAPLSLAGDQSAPTPPEPATPPAAEAPESGKTVTKNVMRWITKDDDTGESKGFEIREKDGVKTYLRVSRDGTTEELTREELAAEYGDDFDEVIKAPRVHAKRIVIDRDGTHEEIIAKLARDSEAKHRVRAMMLGNSKDSDRRIEVEVEDGETKAYQIEEDGTRTEIDLDDMEDIRVEVLSDDNSFFFADKMDGQIKGLAKNKIMIFNSDEDVSVWTDEDGNVHRNEFVFGLGGQGGMHAAQARLQAAQSMIESTDRMIADLREEAKGSSDGDLRKAERELEKAQKALEKAMKAVRESEKR